MRTTERQLRKALVDLRAELAVYGFGGGDLPTTFERRRRRNLLRRIERLLEKTK